MTKIVVGKGKSVSVGGPEGEWLKVFYQVEAVLDEGEDPVAARLGIEHMLDQWLQGELVGPEVFPKLDPADLDALPWLTYQTKEPAEPGKAGWIKNPAYFSNFFEPAAAELSKALTRAGGKLELGEHIYQFSGKEKQFISRKPVKRKENPGGWERRGSALEKVKEAGRRLAGE